MFCRNFYMLYNLKHPTIVHIVLLLNSIETHLSVGWVLTKFLMKMCPVSASDIRKLWSSPFLKGQAPAAGYHPAGPEMGSSWSAGHRMKYCLDTGWWGNSEAQMCSWRRWLEPMPFPEGVEGNTVARHPGSDCSDQLGYETSDSKPVMGNEQLVTWWRNEKGKIGEDRDGKPVSCCLDHNGPLDRCL